jgi:hypothetical protein
MINFNLGHFLSALRLLGGEAGVAQVQGTALPDTPVREDDVERFIPKFKIAADHFARMHLSHACQRVERINAELRLRKHEITYSQLVSQLNTLFEAVEDDIKFERFFHYRQERVRPYMNRSVEWAQTASAFPSAADEVAEGLDCYALEHNTACVFHMMRVAELGMRTLARERQVTFPRHPLEWADWENIIDQIEKNARDATVGMPRGPERDAARAFYTAAVAQLRAFKETRNRIMHVRGSFDELDAQRAINQIRDFMNGLSAKIGEKTRGPIRRWP